MSPSNRTTRILAILAGGFVLCFLAFYNKYPLVFPDTGTYLLSGFTGQVPRDRPMIYGLFIRHVSLWETLWLVILLQGILLSLTVFYYFRYLGRTKNYLPWFLAYIFLITFSTGASLNVSQLIPDVFTSISILSLGLLVFVRDLKLRDLIIISVLLAFSIAVHTSHLMLVLSIVVLLSVLFLFKKIRTGHWYLTYKRLFLIWGLIALSYLSVASTQLGFGGKFTFSEGKHVFLMSRLNEMGILNLYLQDNCDEKEYKLCAYKDEIIWGFIWDENSPLYQTGGWEANKAEYRAIFRDLFTTPKYLKIFLIRSLESSFKQFFNFETGDAPVLGINSEPYGAVKNFMKGQEMEYLSSRQRSGRLDFRFINNIQYIVIALSLSLTIILLILRIPMERKYLMIYILVAIFLNAAICGTFSGISPRYQSRVVWLLPLPLLLLITGKPLREILKGPG